MRYLYRYVLTIALSAVYAFSFCQEIPVNLYTGTPQIYIPLHTISDHGISETIGISYNASGVRLAEQTGQLGIGWRYATGGAVMREVRGLPDDYNTAGRSGWLYNSNAQNASSFANSADASTSTCSDESTDYTALNGYNYVKDTEPDVYHYQAGGISGSFVFDNSLNIRLIPYRDVTISYTTVSGTDKTITSFIITDNSGMTYTFAYRINNTVAATSMSGSTIDLLKTDFKLYDKSVYAPGVYFAQTWELTKKQSGSGAILNYGYSPAGSGASADTVTVGIRKKNDSRLYKKNLYYIQYTKVERELTSISNSSGDSVLLGDSVLVVKSSRRSPSLVKEFKFNYKMVGDRKFLESVQETSACASMPPYKFSYVSVDLVNGKCKLPSIYSDSKDFWGYYNGRTNSHPFPKVYVYPSLAISERHRVMKIPNYAGTYYELDGADRTPDAASMQIGSLETITYPTGGSSIFNYEPNDFYDAVAQTTYLGSGLRIKSITEFDGLNPSKRMIRNFSYKTAANLSSGTIFSKPLFVIPTYEYRDPEGTTVKSYASLSATPQQMYEHLLVRSRNDLNEDFDGTSIGYSMVTVSRPGSGSSVHEFAVPAAYGTASQGDWVATTDKFARSSPCSSMGIIGSGGAWTFPNVTNPNFSYERGFETKCTEKDELGVKLSETTYTPAYIYKSGSTPYKVWGVSYETFAYAPSTVYLYGKYFMLTDVDKVVGTITTTNYDIADATKFTTQSESFLRESTYHKLLTTHRVTGFDGTVLETKYKYPKDYGTIPTDPGSLPPTNSDVMLSCLRTMQSKLNGVPVEQMTTRKGADGITRTLSAGLTLYSDFGTSGKVLPLQNMSLDVASGITDFLASSVSSDGTDYYFNKDSRYRTQATFLKFDSYDVPISSIGNSRIQSTTVWGHNTTVPVIQTSGVSDDQFAFSNFETEAAGDVTGNEFTVNMAKYYSAGHTGNNALRFNGSYKLSKTINKSEGSYKLSFWLKKYTGPIDVKVTIKNASTSAVISTVTYNVAPQGTGFEYFEYVLSVASAPQSFIVEVENITASSVSYIDDVAFFGSKTDWVSYTYDFPHGVNSNTTSGGISTRAVYDALGRQTHVFDQDNDLVSKTSYLYPSVPYVVTACVNGHCNDNDVITVGDYFPFTFTADDDPCIADEKFEWDIGAGYVEGTNVKTTTYNLTGQYALKLRKSHPSYGSIVRTVTVNVVPSEAAVGVCAKGLEEFQCMSVVSTFSCTSISNSPATLETYFKVTGPVTVNGQLVNENIVSYVWEKLGSGGVWIPIDPPATAAQLGPISANSGGYSVRCKVTSSAPGIVRTGYTPPVSVIYQTSCN